MENLQQVLPRGVVTLVFTDIEGSSSASDKFGAAFETVRNEHFRLLRVALREADGFEIKTVGDALFVAFSEASGAVRFAISAQQKMLGHDWEVLLPGINTVRIRIGMHTGEPFILHDEVSGRPDYHGPVSNLAARVQSAAHGGQIILSGTTQALVARALPPAVTLRDCGRHRLKGVGEEHLWQLCHPELPSEFPPLATLNPQRHNLPVPLTPLIGREQEIAQWHELLRQPATRVLTLCAFGGMGKTRAALQLAEICALGHQDVEPGEDVFTNGVWWVALDDARSIDAMVGCIARSVGLLAQPNLPLKDQLWNFLRERSLLLVLDNTEQIAQAGNLVNEMLQVAPNVKCLVTTRQPLGLLAELKCEVSPLPLDEAARLFVESVRQTGTSLSPADSIVREVCQRLEGVPLALELAASRASALSPTEILEHLDDQFRLLRSRAPDLPPRQRALRGAIDWSYDMLSPENQELFAELSVFASGFTLVDADGVAESGDAFDGVMELHRCSLLRSLTDAQTQRTRYFMLESLRAYATEKLNEAPDGGAGARQRHAKHFAGMIDKFSAQLRSGSESQALAQCAPHLDNARAALRFALETQKFDLAARLSLSLGRMLQRYGSFREAAQLLQSGRDAAAKYPQLEVALHAHLQFARAGAYYDTFDWQRATELAESALVLFEECGDICGQADAWNLMGLLALRVEKDFAVAQERFARAVTLFSQGSCPIGVALARNNQGLAEYEAKLHGNARPHFEAALEVYREEGYHRGIAEALTNLGVLAEDVKETEQAWNYYYAAFEIELALQNQFGVARALYNLGEIAAMRGQKAEAARFFTTAEVLFERGGSPYVKFAAKGREASVSGLPSDAAFITELPIFRARLKEKSLTEVAQWTVSE